jgi:hypothetical protein
MGLGLSLKQGLDAKMHGAKLDANGNGVKPLATSPPTRRRRFGSLTPSLLASRCVTLTPVATASALGPDSEVFLPEGYLRES